MGWAQGECTVTQSFKSHPCTARPSPTARAARKGGGCLISQLNSENLNQCGARGRTWSTPSDESPSLLPAQWLWPGASLVKYCKTNEICRALSQWGVGLSRAELFSGLSPGATQRAVMECRWSAHGFLALHIWGRRITLWSKSTFSPSQKGDGSEGCRKPRWLSPFSLLALLSRLHSLFICCMWLEGCCWPWRTYSVSHFDGALCLFCYSAAENQWKLILAYCSYCSKHSRILCPDCPRKIPFHFSPIL